MTLLAPLLAGAAIAADGEVERRVLVLVRALAYDRTLPGDGALRVALSGPATEPDCIDAAAVLDRLRGVTVSSRPLAPASWLEAAPASWADALASVDVVLACGHDRAALAPVADAAEGRGVLVVALDGALVGHGVSLGVGQDGTRLQLRIDLPTAKAQGASFAGELLELAVPVGR